ncbi:MAG: porphobilinogen synthase [Bacteroidetes bacterium]|nr:MAG: porphobilinogen synthase [Bacteroidota bacterium]
MYLPKRFRTLRSSAAIRGLVAEHTLLTTDFIAPVFVVEGTKVREPISAMPGYYRFSLDTVLQEIEELYTVGIRAVLLFVKCADSLKDNKGAEALNKDGLMQRSIKTIKNAYPNLCVMTDVALDPFSIYGHDGIVQNGEIINDATVEVLAAMSVSHAEAGADFVAPSDMMDGRVAAIRKALEQDGFTQTGIMSYSAKYASCLYGPFRSALDSAPGFGDKKTYQMNYANSKEAMAETLMDIDEGADIVMVKPGLWYLDVVKELREKIHTPISVYQVSGEYAMIKAAATHGWLKEDEAILESLTACKRAGASLIATYFAKKAAQLLKNIYE